MGMGSYGCEQGPSGRGVVGNDDQDRGTGQAVDRDGRALRTSMTVDVER